MSSSLLVGILLVGIIIGAAVAVFVFTWAINQAIGRGLGW